MLHHSLVIGCAIAACSMGLMGCNQAASNSAQPSPSITSTTTSATPALSESPKATVEAPTVPSPAPQTALDPNRYPTVGTVKQLVNGDLMCYATLVDERGVERQVGASFEICDQQATFLNQRVRATYKLTSVSDCQSAEPCGKTRKEYLITAMTVIEPAQSDKSRDTRTITNGKWTITVGNFNSWNGVNGTGNLTYRGCDARGQCINLSQGQMTCRDGVCTTAWRNGDYTYVLTEPMRSPDNPTGTAPTLIVRQGDTVILKADGFREL